MRKKSSLTLGSSRKKKARTAAVTAERELEAAAEGDNWIRNKREGSAVSAAAVADGEAAAGASEEMGSPGRSSRSSRPRSEERVSVSTASPRQRQPKQQRQRQQQQQVAKEEEMLTKRKRQRRKKQDRDEEGGGEDAAAEGSVADRRTKNSTSSSATSGRQHNRRLLRQSSPHPLSTSRWRSRKSVVCEDGEGEGEDDEQQKPRQTGRNRRRKKVENKGAAESGEEEEEISSSDGEDAGTSDEEEERHARGSRRSGNRRLSSRSKMHNRSRKPRNNVGGERRSSSGRRDVRAEKERGRTRAGAAATRGSNRQREVNAELGTGSAVSSSGKEEEEETEDASDATAAAVPARGVSGLRRRQGRGAAGTGARSRSRRRVKRSGGSGLERGRSGRQQRRQAPQEKQSNSEDGDGGISSGSTSRSGGEAEEKTVERRQKRRRGQGKRRREKEESPEKEQREDTEQTDQWYDDYFSFTECNVQDELLLDVLVATIKKSHAQHYYGSAGTTDMQQEEERQQLQDVRSIGKQQEGEIAQGTREERPQREKALSFLASLRKNGVSSRKGVGVMTSLAPAAVRESRRDKKRRPTEEELAQAAATAAEFERAEATLRTMTSDALLIKKAWAYVAEEAFEARIAATAASPPSPTAASADGVNVVAPAALAATKRARRREEGTALGGEQRQQQRGGAERSGTTDAAADAAAAGAAEKSSGDATTGAGLLPPGKGRISEDNPQVAPGSALAPAERSQQNKGEKENEKQEAESDKEEGVKGEMLSAEVEGKESVPWSTSLFSVPFLSSPTSTDDALMMAVAAAAATAAAEAAKEEAVEGTEPHETGLRARWQKYVLLRRQRLVTELRIQDLIRFQEQQDDQGGAKRRRQQQHRDDEKSSTDETGREAAPGASKDLVSRAAAASFPATGPCTASGVSAVAAAFMAAKDVLKPKEELMGKPQPGLAVAAHKRGAAGDRNKEEEEDEMKTTIKTKTEIQFERRLSSGTTVAVDATDTAKTTADASPAAVAHYSLPATATPAVFTPNNATGALDSAVPTAATSLEAAACAAGAYAGTDISKLRRAGPVSSSQQELKRQLLATEGQERDASIVAAAGYKGKGEGGRGGGGGIDSARRGDGANNAEEVTAVAVERGRGAAAGGDEQGGTLRNIESVEEDRGRGKKSSGARERKERREGFRCDSALSSHRSRSRTPCGEDGSSRSLSLRRGQEEEGDEGGGTREKDEEEEKAEKLLRKLTQADADESLTSSSSSSPSENDSSDEEDSLYEEDTALGEPSSSPEEEEEEEEGTTAGRSGHHKHVASKIDEEYSRDNLSAAAGEKRERATGGIGGAHVTVARDRAMGVTASFSASEADAEEEETEQEGFDGVRGAAEEDTVKKGSTSDGGAEVAAAAAATAKKKKLSTAAKLRLRWEREKQKKRRKAGETIMEDVFARCSAAPLSIDQATKMKNLSVPSTLLLRPQCLYTVEDDWEKLHCRKYPNGLLRRGTVATRAFRIEETLEFFLFCRFLNLFASTIDIQWTFDSLVAGFACVSPLPPFPAAAAAANKCGGGACTAGTAAKPSRSDDNGAPADPPHTPEVTSAASVLPEEAACSSKKTGDDVVGGGGEHGTSDSSNRSASSTSESTATPSNTENVSRRFGGNNYGSFGNTELFRLLLQKIFSFVGRRFSPGMSLVRMCGRYVEEKRKEGVLPVGMLWPFDYSFKFCATKRAARDRENGARDSSSREASNRTSSAKESNSNSEKDSRKEDSSKESKTAAEASSTKRGGREDRVSSSKETCDVEERSSSCNGTSKKSAPFSTSSRSSVKGMREDDEAEGTSGGETVLMESVYNPFKLCDEWNQLKSIHKLRVVRLLIDQVLSESSQIQKARKKLSDADLEFGYKGTDSLGKLYWLVPQCGDETVFKLYREDPNTQRVEILCEDIAGLESVAEALGMDEKTAEMKDVLLRCHDDLLIQEKQKSRELRRDKARRRQLEISAWGLPSSARRERKPVDYTYAAYDGALDGRIPAGATATSSAEGQRLDRGERLRARLAKKEERMTAEAVEIAENSGDAAVLDGSGTTAPGRQSVSANKDTADTKKLTRKKQPKGAAVVLRSQADVLRQHQAYLMQHRHHSHFALQQSQALLFSQQLQRLQEENEAAARQAGSGPLSRVYQQQQQQPLLGAVGSNVAAACSGPVAQLPQAALAVLQQRLQQVHHHLLQQEGLTAQQRQAALHHACARLQAELLARYGIVSAERPVAAPQLQQQLLQQHLLRQQQQQQLQARQQMQQQQAMHQHLQQLQEHVQRQQFLHPSQQQHHHHQLSQHNVQDSDLLGRRAALLQQSYQAQQLSVARGGGGALSQQQAQPSNYAVGASFNAGVHSTNGTPPVSAPAVSANAASEAVYAGFVRQPTGGIEASTCRTVPIDTARHTSLVYGGADARISCSGSCDKEDTTHRRGSSTSYDSERRVTQVDAGNSPIPLPGAGTGYSQGSRAANVVPGGTAPTGGGGHLGNMQYAMWTCAGGRHSAGLPSNAVLSHSVGDPPSSHASAPGRAPGGATSSPYPSLSSIASLHVAGHSLDSVPPSKASTSHSTAQLPSSLLDGGFTQSSSSQSRGTSQSSCPIPAHVDTLRPSSHALPSRVPGYCTDSGKYSVHP